MSRLGRAARGLALGAALLAVAAGCSPAASQTPGPIPTSTLLPPASATMGPSTAAVPGSPVTGVLTKVDSAGLDKVSGFTLRTDAGEQLLFTIGTLENGTEFPPGHLPEHLATGSPVRVFFRVEGADLVVYRLEDAD